MSSMIRYSFVAALALGGVALFLKAQFGRDEIPRSMIQALRAEVSPMEPGARAEHLLRDMPPDRMAALGLDTPEGRLDYATKLPAKLTLLLHIMRSIGLDTLTVSQADARHLLINGQALAG